MSADSDKSKKASGVVPEPAIKKFKKSVFGKVVLPGDPDYGSAKTDVNVAYTSSPQLVVFCVCLADVRACLALAQKYSAVPVARAGRHSLAGFSGNDGIVVDVSEMNGVVVNYHEKTAVVGAGTQFGKLNACLQSYGLHVPGGGCPTVAVAGYMQGGGYGFTSREFGMHCDNVLSFTMLLANRKVVEASAEKNPDLFWAVRGGTGNQFGVLLEVRYKLYKLAEVGGVRLSWPIDKSTEYAAQALVAIQNKYINSDQHNKLGFQTAIAKNSDNVLCLNFCAIYNGTEDDFDSALGVLTSIPECKVDMRLRGQYSTVDETLLARIPDIHQAMQAMTSSRYIEKELSADDYGQLLDFANTFPGKIMIIDMEGYGGEIRTVAPEAMAFMHRNVIVDLFCDVFWNVGESGEAEIKWLQELMQRVSVFSNGHSYQNYPNRLQQDWRWAYFGKYYNTLLWIKQKFDAENLFSFEQSITPPPADLPVHEYAELLFSDEKIDYENY